MRHLTLAIALAALVPALAPAQTAPAAETAPAAPSTSIPRGISVFIGTGWSTLSGPASKGGGFGGGLMGVSYERPIDDRFTWRAEGNIIEALTDLGEMGLLQSPTSLHSQRLAVGLGVRRYATRGRYLGVGASVAFDNWCYAVQEGGIGVTGTSTTDCPEFTDRTLEASGPSLNGVLTAGIQRGRFSYEARYDHGIMRAVLVDGEGLRARSVNAAIHYRFGTPASGEVRGRRAIPPLPGQIAAGMLGWGAGLLGGILVGSALATDSNDWVTPLLGGLAGTPIGTTAGVHIYGRRHGLRSNMALTFGGALVGMYGGPAIMYTMPAGAAMAYNSVSRER
jgi:hypothetical protein